MFVLAFEVDVHINESRSLKAKRGVIKAILEGARHRYSVAAAEVGFQDQWQRALLGFATVSSSHHHAVDVVDELERFVWSHPEIEVVTTERRWVERRTPNLRPRRIPARRASTPSGPRALPTNPN